MEYRFAKLAEYLRGWMGYFGIAEYYRPLPEIDHWLRRRVRMCYLKRWRRCRTKVRELTKLGCNLESCLRGQAVPDPLLAIGQDTLLPKRCSAAGPTATRLIGYPYTTQH